MFKIVSGNLIQLAYEGHFDVIVHGCNCFNTMGSGIASDIKRHFPTAYEADQRTLKGDRNKLGTYTYEIIPQFGKAENLFVVNAYTQYHYGKGGPHFDYDAFDRVLMTLEHNFPNLRFGFPRIGSGLAGGDQDRIEAQIREGLIGKYVTIVDWDGTHF